MKSLLPFAAALPLMMACGGSSRAPRDDLSITTSALVTYIGSNKYIEIDRSVDTACGGGAPNGACVAPETAANCPSDCARGADANLFTGPDPADSTASVQAPTCSGAGCSAVFLDWNDLARSRDINDRFASADPTAFPGSAACVGSASSPSGQELTTAAIASNLQYAYLALTRAAAAGNSSYFWVINKVAPTLTPGPINYVDFGGAAKSCSAGTSLLSFTLTAGDILLVGDFEPAVGTTARTFVVRTARSAVDARSVVDFAALTTAGIYQELIGSGVRNAVNTTVTATAGFGGSTGTFGLSTFTESAVPMATFNTAGACGQSFHATAISKASSSATSDMKDLIGPLASNLGVVTPSATFAATCDSNARFSASATGPDGNALPGASLSCAWTFRDAAAQVVATRSTCSGYLPLPTGSISATATVTDLESGCPATVSAGPITIVATTVGACEAATCDPATGATTTAPRPSSYVCRAAAGVCDLAESCNGTSLTCPADVRGTAVCRASGGVCDPAESCNGVAVDCPPNTLLGSDTTCRGAAGICDAAEVCSGSSALCPTDAREPAGMTCRASGGVCDPAELCDGTSIACAADTLASGTVCRAATGECDVAEQCSGASRECPADSFAASTTTCGDDGNVCTLDRCDGAGACAHPAGNLGAVCRAAAGLCDAPELCRGNTPICPADAFAIGVTCRDASGPCDVAEACDGSGRDCPGDVIAAAGTTCRAAAGGCDLGEACTGSSVACPSDTLVSAGAVCRPAVGECDVAEACTGGGPLCPSDGFASSATACSDDANPCTTPRCDGAGACAHVPGNAGATCRAAAGACDAAEACTGSAAACPADGFLAGVECRPALDQCDVPESCPGNSPGCPADQLAAAGVVCRPLAGTCDVAEECTGSLAGCPPDVKRSSLCRAASGVCDAAEYCDGNADACPDDALMVGTLCRAATGPCDIEELCSGAASCPVDELAAAGSVCGDPLSDCSGPACTGTSSACPVATGYCGDADACTIDDVCVAGTCTGEPETCELFVFFLVITDAAGQPRGSVRCTHEPGNVRCATLDPVPGDDGPPVLDVRPELMCEGGTP